MSYVVADHPMGPFVSEVETDGPKVLRTRPEQAIGPGHASVVCAPDNLHEYVVYHAWDPQHTSRLMRIDQLDWSGHEPSSPAPTLEPQPAPPLPLFCDGFDGPDGMPPNPGAWRVDGGEWRQRGGELVQREAGAKSATALLVNVPPHQEYLLEVNVRLVEGGDKHGRYGVRLDHSRGNHTHLTLTVDGSSLMWNGGRNTHEAGRELGLQALGSGFRSDVYHQLLLSVRSGGAEVRVDGVRVASGLKIPPGAGSVGLFTQGVSAAFDGVSVTPLKSARI